jgi:glycosyltransferase involved in cell wall biosynthesis
MRLRVVDYVANLGGGTRFSVELIRALVTNHDVSVEIVSYGEGLRMYRELLSDKDGVRFADIAPASGRRARGFAGFRGAGRANALLGVGRPHFHFDVPKVAFDNCDLVWLPWLHRHRIPWSLQDKVIASLHDITLVEFPGILDERRRRNEQETVRRWLASSARIVVSSNTTAKTLARMFGCTLDRVRVIPLSGQHVRPQAIDSGVSWPFSGSPYLICPANTNLHKNHEVLFSGIARSNVTYPLVLTGGGTDFWLSSYPRAVELRKRAEEAGLEWNRSLFGLGYLADPAYYSLLGSAWALVMPTLAEGGGSFPVAEAMQTGIPVIASDIPVMREWVDRMAGRILWFDPSSPDALATTLAELDRNYPTYKKVAVEQIRTMTSRSWADVAADYAAFMGI